MISSVQSLSHVRLCDPMNCSTPGLPVHHQLPEFTQTQCMCKVKSEVAHSLRPVECSPPSSSVHGIFQARILEWVAISFSRGSSQSRDQTCISCLAGRFFTTEPSGKSQRMLFLSLWNHGISSFPGGSEGKASAYNVGDLSSIPGLGRSPGEGNGNPFQYSCLENPMDREAW